MDAHTAAERRPTTLPSLVERFHAIISNRYVIQLVTVFLAYFIAGKLGQATTNIRSGNLGPVWPASGIALAAVLAYGYRIWPGIAAGCFLVAFQSPVSALTALGQAIGATGAALSGGLLIMRGSAFDPALSRLRDALALVVYGALGSSILSASIGMASLYASGQQAYSGLTEAWLIYWLGDATGVLLVTPLVFTLPTLFAIRSRARLIELSALMTLLVAACVVIFGDLPLFPIRLHVLAFAVLPFVMWAAIEFGVGGASLSVFVTAAIATVLTAFGYGPFSTSTPFVNAALLDVLFTVLAITGLALAAVIAERERAEAERERLTTLSSLGRRLIEAQELERSRIARELHDDIGQRLALLASNLTLLTKRAHPSDRIDPRASDLQLRTSEIAADVQALSHRLHSSKLELLGITVAMRHFCSEFGDQHKRAVRFDSRAMPDRLPPDLSLCLFRILQEALHNGAKHSDAERFDVKVWGEESEVHLVISDRGKGFDVEAARRGRGIGLISMEERIKLVHGTLSIESQPGRGTTIHAWVPITPSQV